MYLLGQKPAQSRIRTHWVAGIGDVTKLAPPRQERWWDKWLRRPLFEPKALKQTGVALVGQQEAAGTLFNSYTTAKSVINPTALVPYGVNNLDIGKTIRVTVYGGLSNIITTPGTVTFQIMMGNSIGWTSGAIQMNATAHTLFPFWMQITLSLRTKGSGTGATFWGGGPILGTHFTRTAATSDLWGVTPAVAIANVSDAGIVVPDLAPAVGSAGFDSTITSNLDFWVGFSISQPTNGVQVQTYTVEDMN